MAFRRRGFRRGWGGPFWGPAPLLYTGAAVGAGYAIGRRGGDYYGEDPYPQPGVAPQQRPSQILRAPEMTFRLAGWLMPNRHHTPPSPKDQLPPIARRLSPFWVVLTAPMPATMAASAM